jgi:hypothetical protein
MEGKLFSAEELEHRINEIGEIPPMGTQWWEMPVHLIPASVVYHGNDTAMVYLLLSEEDFNERPMNARLVAFQKDKANFQPQKKPSTLKTKSVRRRAPYRNLAAIFG